MHMGRFLELKVASQIRCVWYLMNANSPALQIKAEIFKLSQVGLGKHHPKSTSPTPFYFTR